MESASESFLGRVALLTVPMPEQEQEQEQEQRSFVAALRAESGQVVQEESLAVSPGPRQVLRRQPRVHWRECLPAGGLPAAGLPAICPYCCWYHWRRQD